MGKNKVKSQTILRVAMIASLVVFMLSACSLIYFRFYFNNSFAVSSTIRASIETMQGALGYFFYIIIPGVIVLGLVLWNLIANNMESVISKSDNNILQVDGLQMQKMAFENDDNINYDIINDVITQTLKSPIQIQKPDTSLNDLGHNESQQFAPNYIFEKDISSIKELKEVIAKNKVPEVFICTDGDTTNLSSNCKEKIQRINSFDANKVIEHIKQKNLEIEKLSEVKHILPKLTYKAVNKNNKPSKEKIIEENKHNSLSHEKYLTADEIIELYRKKDANKKFTPTFVSTDFDDENKGLSDLAKLYYVSQIGDYAVKE